MKSTILRIKILSLFTAVALFVGIGMVFGFKPFDGAPDKATITLAPAWYEYDEVGDVTEASSYNLISPQPSDEAASLCPGTNGMCALKAEPGTSGHPAEFSLQLQQDIENAVDNHKATSNIKLQN